MLACAAASLMPLGKRGEREESTDWSLNVCGSVPFALAVPVRHNVVVVEWYEGGGRLAESCL